jgi:hypothetical protein
MLKWAWIYISLLKHKIFGMFTKKRKVIKQIEKLTAKDYLPDHKKFDKATFDIIYKSPAHY